MQQHFALATPGVFIEDFSCAIKRRIMLHGRMYISSEYVCFRSDIFGVKTMVVLPLREVVSFRKSVADIINPSIEICTATDRHVFASFFASRGLRSTRSATAGALLPSSAHRWQHL